MTDIFKDGRLVFASGRDIQIIHYRQDMDTEKAHMALEEHLLVLLLYGYKTVWHSQGKLQVSGGEGFFLAKGNYLRTERRMDPLSGYQSLVIRLGDAFLAAATDSPGAARPTGHQVFHLRQDLLVTSLVQQLVQYFQAPGEKARIEALLPLKIRELLLLLSSARENNGFGDVVRHLPFIKESSLATLMEAHFRESLTLEQWAFLANMSLSSFKRKFESVYQMPPGKWIQQRRLEEAYGLLGGSHMNVTEVCYSVGFENLAHFIQAFKDKYHITPKQRQLAEQSLV